MFESATEKTFSSLPSAIAINKPLERVSQIEIIFNLKDKMLPSSLVAGSNVYIPMQPSVRLIAVVVDNFSFAIFVWF